MRRLGLYLGRLPGFDKIGAYRQDLIECVRAADSAGYDSFWLPESWEREAFSTLAELATRTSRIALCTGIVNVFSRSPALIAMSAATLDEASEGRFRLGLGTSGARVIQDFHGMKYERPLTRLKETIQIVRSLLAGEPAELHGKCFEVNRFKLGFKPFRPEIPIYLAALTPASIRQVGDLANGWLPAYWPADQLAAGLTEINRGAGKAGRDPASIEIAPLLTVSVSDNLERARDRARLPLAYYVGGMGSYYHDALARIGFGDEADRIRDMWAAGRPRDAIRAVTDEMIERIAICGSLENCREKILECYSHGATLPIIPIPPEGTTREKCRIIESLIK